MKKKLLLAVLCAAVVMGLTACGEQSGANASDTAGNDSASVSDDSASVSDSVQSDPAVADVGEDAATTMGDESKITEYIATLELTNTIDEINQTVGFDGVIEEKDSYSKCTWTFSEETSLTALFKEDGTIYNLKATFAKKTIKNDSVDFSRYSEIEAAMDTDESIDYDHFVEVVGGVQGTVVEKSTITTQYMWVNSDNGYLSASFSCSDGKCTFVSGWF